VTVAVFDVRPCRTPHCTPRLANSVLLDVTTMVSAVVVILVICQIDARLDCPKTASVAPLPLTVTLPSGQLLSFGATQTIIKSVDEGADANVA
jgi:hypothetical protein